MSAKWLDSHVHLADLQFRSEIQQVIERAKAQGVEKMVSICLAEEEIDFSIALQKKYPFVAIAAAVHPNDVENADSKFFERLKTAPLCAIGETGIDYYRSKNQALQVDFLKRHMALAQERSLPLLVHLRSSETDSAQALFFQIADEEKFLGKVVLHCFCGTKEEAEEALQRGWTLSFSGNITYPKNEALREVARRAPLSQIQIETDAPFLAPQPFRGKRNEPSYVIHVAKAIAESKGISEEELSKEIMRNGEKIFQF